MAVERQTTAKSSWNYCTIYFAKRHLGIKRCQVDLSSSSTHGYNVLSPFDVPDGVLAVLFGDLIAAADPDFVAAVAEVLGDLALAGVDLELEAALIEADVGVRDLACPDEVGTGVDLATAGVGVFLVADDELDGPETKTPDQTIYCVTV